MDTQLFHIFRNTPLGRETLLQSIYFCNKINASIVIYIPEYIKFLMYFENDVVQVDLDNSYLISPDNALEHAKELVEKRALIPRFLTPKNFTASTLPDIPVNFDFMCCPRSISDITSKITLGYIGTKVRRIVQSAKFSVLITTPVYSEWKSIAVFFGGSSNAVNALKMGISIARKTDMEINLFTQLEDKPKKYYEEIIKNENLNNDVNKYVKNWTIFEKENFEYNLYDVPHNALVVLGAYGHNAIKNFIFGSKMEKIQSTMCNNLLVVGPNFRIKG